MLIGIVLCGSATAHEQGIPTASETYPLQQATACSERDYALADADDEGWERP